MSSVKKHRKAKINKHKRKKKEGSPVTKKGHGRPNTAPREERDNIEKRVRTVLTLFYFMSVPFGQDKRRFTAKAQGTQRSR